MCSSSHRLSPQRVSLYGNNTACRSQFTFFNIEKMIKHLPSAIQRLLALRNPNSFPSPPLAKLHRLFTDTLQDAQAREAETGWLVLTVKASHTPNFYLFI